MKYNYTIHFTRRDGTEETSTFSEPDVNAAIREFTARFLLDTHTISLIEAEPIDEEN